MLIRQLWFRRQCSRALTRILKFRTLSGEAPWEAPQRRAPKVRAVSTNPTVCRQAAQTPRLAISASHQTAQPLQSSPRASRLVLKPSRPGLHRAALQATPAASEESVKLDSPAGFAWLEDKPPHVRSRRYLCPPAQSGGLTRFLVCDVPETRGSGLQITPQCVSDLQPHSDHGAGGSPVLSGCVHFLNKK